MQLGTSLFLIAIGAILKFAVTDRLAGVDISMVGLILMIIGVIGLVLSLFMMSRPRPHDTTVTRREYRDPPV